MKEKSTFAVSGKLEEVKELIDQMNNHHKKSKSMLSDKKEKEEEDKVEDKEEDKEEEEEEEKCCELLEEYTQISSDSFMVSVDNHFVEKFSKLIQLKNLTSFKVSNAPRAKPNFFISFIFLSLCLFAVLFFLSDLSILGINQQW